MSGEHSTGKRYLGRDLQPRAPQHRRAAAGGHHLRIQAAREERPVVGDDAAQLLAHQHVRKFGYGKDRRLPVQPQVEPGGSGKAGQRPEHEPAHAAAPLGLRPGAGEPLLGHVFRGPPHRAEPVGHAVLLHPLRGADGGHAAQRRGHAHRYYYFSDHGENLHAAGARAAGGPARLQVELHAGGVFVRVHRQRRAGGAGSGRRGTRLPAQSGAADAHREAAERTEDRQRAIGFPGWRSVRDQDEDHGSEFHVRGLAEPVHDRVWVRRADGRTPVRRGELPCPHRPQAFERERGLRHQPGRRRQPHHVFAADHHGHRARRRAGDHRTQRLLLPLPRHAAAALPAHRRGPTARGTEPTQHRPALRRNLHQHQRRHHKHTHNHHHRGATRYSGSSVRFHS
mmetsp:Transcript_25244/g.63514  ORF Transcript_25244/g.63514 Transcript_25244/m.63514 type:complete len:396 (-) Transcript_25244:2274-3461(-)